MDGLIPLELVVTDVKEGSRIPWFHYADGAIVADFEHPLPDVSVPEVIQIVVVPAGKYTITLPAAPGFVLQVRQHRVVIASGTTSFSFAVGLFVPYASPAWLQGSQPYTAGTLVSVATGTMFSFAFDAAPKGVHALGVSFEAAGAAAETERRGGVVCVQRRGLHAKRGGGVGCGAAGEERADGGADAAVAGAGGGESAAGAVPAAVRQRGSPEKHEGDEQLQRER